MPNVVTLPKRTPSKIAPEAVQTPLGLWAFDRADKIMARLPLEIDRGRTGVLVFASDLDASIELTNALIARMGHVQANLTDRLLSAFEGHGEQLGVIPPCFRRTPRGIAYIPSVLNLWQLPALQEAFLSDGCAMLRELDTGLVAVLPERCRGEVVGRSFPLP